MAKTSSVERNKKREKLAKKWSGRRERLKAIATDDKRPMEERFLARLKLAEVPRNASRGGLTKRSRKARVCCPAARAKDRWYVPPSCLR